MDKPIIDNAVIEALDKNHAKRVGDFWMTLGLGEHTIFARNREDFDTYRFYGVVDGKFRAYSSDEIDKSDAKLLFLPKHKPHYKNMEDGFFPQVGDRVTTTDGYVRKVVTVSEDGMVVYKSEVRYYTRHCSELIFIRPKRFWEIF